MIFSYLSNPLNTESQGQLALASAGCRGSRTSNTTILARSPLGAERVYIMSIPSMLTRLFLRLKSDMSGLPKL